jgi:hypothetical protein
MTCFLTESDAQKLYEILDNGVGVFRSKSMSRGAERFHEEKKQEFLKKFSTSIPEEYWFQGVNIPSITLLFTSATGFKVIPSETPHREAALELSAVNEKLSEATFELQLSEDL